MTDFEKSVQQFIEQEKLLVGSKKLLIACSGGVDSMALLTFFVRNRVTGIDLYVAHVDHMLRGEASAMDRLFVERFCADHHIPIFSTAIPIAEILTVQGGNSQAVCRMQRYQFLEMIMREQTIDTLVTAHHADDQLESLLMALAKSGNLNGMQGIHVQRPFASGKVIRPFLMVTKEEIRQYLQGVGGEFREDESNAKDTYTRNRVRHHILPLLKQENPFVSQHATQISLQLRQDDLFLQQLAEEAFRRLVEKKAQNCYELEIPALLNEPVALQRRLILILLNYLYNETNTFQSHTLCTSILKLCQNQEGSAQLSLPKAFIVSRTYGKLVFQQHHEKTPIISTPLVLNEWVKHLGVRVYVGDSSRFIMQNNYSMPLYFSARDVTFPLQIRARLEGDRIQLAGMQQAKRISRLFIDEKIPLQQRDSWPILVDATGDVLAVLGLRTSSKLSKDKREACDYVFMMEQVTD